jgi:hypothetical protein
MHSKTSFPNYTLTPYTRRAWTGRPSETPSPPSPRRARGAVHCPTRFVAAVSYSLPQTRGEGAHRPRTPRGSDDPPRNSSGSLGAPSPALGRGDSPGLLGEKSGLAGGGRENWGGALATATRKGKVVPHPPGIRAYSGKSPAGEAGCHEIGLPPPNRSRLCGTTRMPKAEGRGRPRSQALEVRIPVMPAGHSD